MLFSNGFRVAVENKPLPSSLSVTLNQNDLTESVIPGLTRNPEVHHWIPAFAGMTWLSFAFDMTVT